MGRYIYNRVILENATVRAAAVTALAKFGAACIKLRQSTLTLLKRCLHDNDDEVRPRTHCACPGARPTPGRGLPPSARRGHRRTARSRRRLASNVAVRRQVRDRATFFIAVLEDEGQVDQWVKRTELAQVCGVRSCARARLPSAQVGARACVHGPCALPVRERALEHAAH